MLFALGKTGNRNVASDRFYARQAALALLKMARTTSDPRVAAGLIEAAADLKEQAGELPPLLPDDPKAAQPSTVGDSHC